MKTYLALLTPIICLFLLDNYAVAQKSKVDTEFEAFWQQFQTIMKNKDKNAFLNITEDKIYNIETTMDDYVELRDRAKVFDSKTLETIFKFSSEYLKSDANTIMSKSINGNQGFRNVLKKKFKNKIVYRCSVGTNSSGMDMWFVKVNNQYKIFAVCFDEG